MKDYYAVLGVLPSIEQSVLKAVYSALMKKYHPDVTSIPKEEAERRTKEINEAYSVLGDPGKRADYDTQRKQSASQSGDYNQESSYASSADNLDPQFQNDWKFVISHFPSAEKSRLRLRKISIPLSEFYQILIIGGKMARQSEVLANILEEEFLTHYFGSNEDIRRFVLFLIHSDLKEVLLEINHYVRLVGTPPDSDVDDFVFGLVKKFNIKNYERSEEKTELIAISKPRGRDLISTPMYWFIILCVWFFVSFLLVGLSGFF